MSYSLGRLFWRDLEIHHPGIDSLRLPADVATGWKERITTKITRVRRPRRADHPGARAADQRPGPPARRPLVLPRHHPLGDRGPVPVGSLGRALPDPRAGSLAAPQETIAPQITDGSADPGTAADPARPRQHPDQRLHVGHRPAARRSGRCRRRHLHRRRADPAPVTHHPRHGRQDLGRGPRHRQKTRPEPGGTPGVLDVGRGERAAPHRHSDRGTRGTLPPQPHPLQAARHRRTHPAAADRAVQNRHRTAPGDQPRTGRRAQHHHLPGP